ncbi:MAG: HPF/RaiA family ribosome-associated protein [Nostoc sp. ChiSLP01]|nr:hypothetical protein [Nostoc sp. CmiSLP01]MDZ8287450.1 hypothetical protein [Nostoc sp. ChiSLP01]
MKVTREITYRNLEKTDAIASLINQKIAKLKHICIGLEGIDA